MVFDCLLKDVHVECVAERREGCWHVLSRETKRDKDSEQLWVASYSVN